MSGECCNKETDCGTKKHCAGKALLMLAGVALLALGPATAGYLVGNGIKAFRTDDRSITVRGLATRDVTADLAIWSLTHTVTGNELVDAQTELEANGSKLKGFLTGAGLKEEDIRLQSVQVNDMLANMYRSNEPTNNRYILSQTYVVRTNDVDTIEKAAQNVGDLVKQGVVLSQPNGGGGSMVPQYIFTKLNDVKPAMIKEATESARSGAEQFATDAAQSVGKIRKASQGVFEIQAGDQTYTIPEAEQKRKTVRVVNSVEFELE